MRDAAMYIRVRHAGKILNFQICGRDCEAGILLKNPLGNQFVSRYQKRLLHSPERDQHWLLLHESVITISHGQVVFHVLMW